MKRRRIGIFSLFTLLLFLLTACGDPVGTTVTPSGGGTGAAGSGSTAKTKLVTSDYFDPPPAVQGNPFAPSNIGGMGEFVFDRLFEFIPLPQDTYIPMLAEKYENQGADTRIYLKKDVKWNDGKPFTSKDVICTYYLGYVAGWPMWNYAKSIEAPDDNTVIIHWMKPGAILAQMAFSNAIQAPEHVYGKWAQQIEPFISKRDENGNLSKEDQDQIDKIRQDLYKFKPEPKSVVGTGPYMVSNVTASEGILVKNPNYRDPGNIKIDEVRVQRYVSQEAYMSTVMSNGYDMEPHGLAPDVFKQIVEKSPDMKIIWTPDLGQPSMQYNTAKYPVNIPQVRKAIMCAIDRENLLKVCEPGTEKPDTYSTSMTPLFVKKYIPDDVLSGFENYAFDTAKAAKYLDEIGWKKGSDGFYRNEKGELATIELASMNSWPIFFLGGQNITDQLNKFGLKTIFKPMELSAYWQYLDNGESMMSFDFRGNCPQYGFPWEAFRNVFIDAGARIGLATQVGGQINKNSNAKKQDVIINGKDGNKTFRNGLGHVIYKNTDGSEVDINKEIDKMFNTQDQQEILSITGKLAKISNDLGLLMPLGEKFCPMKVHNKNLKGYSEDRNAPENYGYGMRVIGKMIRAGKLYY